MSLHFTSPDAVKVALEAIRSDSDPTNWAWLGYEAGQKHALELVSSGTGGLDAMKAEIQDSDIRFGVLELLVEGDQYNSVKYVMITFVGPKVPMGMARARTAGHRQELNGLLTDFIAIASQYQPVNMNDFTMDNLAGKVTRVANQSATSTSVGSRKAMSSNRSATKSQALLSGEVVAGELKRLYAAELNWCLLGYVEGSKNDIEFKCSGSGGIEEMKQHLEEDKVLFGVFAQVVTMSGAVAPVTKYLLLTWVGESVGPLAKARSGPHRAEVADQVQAHLPFHSHFPASQQSDITNTEILGKLKEASQ